jgi:hypothetical protein
MSRSDLVTSARSVVQALSRPHNARKLDTGCTLLGSLTDNQEATLSEFSSKVHLITRLSSEIHHLLEDPAGSF